MREAAMNKALIASLSFVVVLAATAAPADSGGSFLLKNVTVHPVSGPKLDNASVLVVDGRIVEVGTKIAAPKTKVKVIDGKGLDVWPGMINSGSTVGMSEIGSIRESNDTGELGMFDPQLRPLVAVNPSSEHIPVVRANGITMTALLPAVPGGRRSDSANAQLIGGQISLAHLAGWTWEEMEVRRAGGMHLSYPAISAVSFDPMTFSSSRRGNTYSKAKQQHDVQVQELTGFFDDARAYWTAKKAGGAVKADLKFEAMIPVLEGKVPLVAFAAHEREIKEAIEFAEKQNVKLVLAGVRKPGATLDAIAKKKIPVILGRTQVETDEEDDPYDEPYTLPSKLNEAGVKFCFGTFDEQFARNLPYQASQGVPFGLPYDAALRSVTLSAAEIWGIDKDYGSIEAGKVADLVVTDGDLLEVKTNVRMLFIRGSEVDLETKHTRLYKKYMARP
jgi:imidazolonepropionase-like amidohydrolase